MGIYRFLLAALVVLFHFGGLDWIVGRIAVFAFYCISGFLIFQVLDRVYLSERHGILRFFCNRFVRLIPPTLGPVERDPARRTWSYTLRSPTPDRIRALLEHRAVEDTAGIDTERLDSSISAEAMTCPGRTVHLHVRAGLSWRRRRGR